VNKDELLQFPPLVEGLKLLQESSANQPVPTTSTPTRRQFLAREN